MHTLRTLRHSRNLSFLDLAQLTGIPVRLLAEAEYGLRMLTGYERSQLAFVFGMDEAAFDRPTTARREIANPVSQSLKQGLVAAAIVTTLATSALRARETFDSFGAISMLPQAAVGFVLPSATASATVTASPTRTTTPSATATRTPTPTTTATASPTTTPTPSPLPTATPVPAFVWTDAGPQGCPLLAEGRRVVITQGWGVGTHAPAETMGGIDLAIDGDGNGYAEGSATLNAVVQATHSGVVQLAPDSWPAGNHVWVIDTATGWRSGYGHLASFLVADGQTVEAGQPIGLVGLTGMTTGPHLHYHVWHGNTNIDPTELVGLCFAS